MSQSIITNPLNHRSNAVGALRREVLLQPQFSESCHGVGSRDFVGGFVGIEGQRDCHQASNKVGIAIAAEVKN